VSASLSERVEATRACAPRIREVLAASPPEPENTGTGVSAALSEYRDDILSALRRGWTVAQLAPLMIDGGVPFSAPSVAKAIDRIVDAALSAEFVRGAKPATAAKRVLGIDLSLAKKQVRSRVERRLARIARLTHTPPSSKRGANNA
jgi:hypothetical protein